MAFGVWAPSVIVSADMLRELPPRQVASVLAHELAHHRRGDLWINWLQMILTILWWFNPLIWMLNRRLRTMREECCDDLLLDRHLASDDGYCQALLDVAGRLARVKALQWLPRFAEQLGPLGERIMRIMDDQTRRRSPWSAFRAPALVLLALLILPGLRVCSPAYRHAAQPDAVAAEPAPNHRTLPAGATVPAAPPRWREFPAALGGQALLPPPSPAVVPPAVTIKLSLSQGVVSRDRPAATVASPAASSAVAVTVPPVRDGLPPAVVMALDMETRLDVALTSRAASHRGLGMMDALALDRPLSDVSDGVQSSAPSPQTPETDPAVSPGESLAKRPEPPQEPSVPADDGANAVPAGPALAMADRDRLGGTPTVVRIDPSDVSDWSDDPFGPGVSTPGVPEPSALMFLALAALPVLRRRA